MSLPITSLEEFEDFRNRVLAVQEVISAMGYGTQARIGYDCKLNASRISNTLRCKTLDLECLIRIEAWIAVQPSIESAVAEESSELATV